MHMLHLSMPQLRIPSVFKDHAIRNKLRETAVHLQRDLSREPGRISAHMPSLKPKGIAMHLVNAHSMHVAFAVNDSNTSLVSVGSPVEHSVDSLGIYKTTNFDVTSEKAPEILETTVIDVEYEDAVTGEKLATPLDYNLTPLEDILSPRDHSLEVVPEEEILDLTHALRP